MKCNSCPNKATHTLGFCDECQKFITDTDFSPYCPECNGDGTWIRLSGGYNYWGTPTETIERCDDCEGTGDRSSAEQYNLVMLRLEEILGPDHVLCENCRGESCDCEDCDNLGMVPKSAVKA